MKKQRGFKLKEKKLLSEEFDENDNFNMLIEICHERNWISVNL